MSKAVNRVLKVVASGNVDAIAAARAAVEQGEFDVAEAWLEVGLSQNPERPDLLSYAAHFAIGRGQRDQAQSYLLRLEKISVLDAIQNVHIGHRFLEQGENQVAEVYLETAVKLEPENASYRFLWATSLGRLGRFKEVLAFLIPFIRSGSASELDFQECISAALRDGRSGLALLLSAAAARAFPHTAGFIDTRARIYLDLGRYEDSLAVLQSFRPGSSLLAAPPEHSFLVSLAYAMLRRYPESLEAVERAHASAPDNLTYTHHLIAVLGCLNRYQEASRLYDSLFSRSEPDESTLRSAFAVYTAAGEYEGAITAGAKLLQLRPDDLVFASVYQTVLGKHLYSKLLSRSVSEPVRARVKSPPMNVSVVDDKIGLAARAIGALFLREMKTRFGRSRLGYLWVIFEPLAHIGVMISIISLFNHTGAPPIGPSFALFYFTGILPFHLFTHTASHLMTAAPENRPLLQIPRVHLMDVFVARSLLEGLTEMIVAGILITLFMLFGLDAMPIDPIGVLGALSILWFAAIGVGIINAVIATFFAGWERIWGAMMSIVYFSSGTFFVPRMMPIWVRDILQWNPILQGIEMVRVHYFHEPSPQWLMTGYLMGWALVPLAVGLSLERLLRRRMLDAE